MKNHCKLNPCCANPFKCEPPDQFDGSYMRDGKWYRKDGTPMVAPALTQEPTHE